MSEQNQVSFHSLVLPKPRGLVRSKTSQMRKNDHQCIAMIQVRVEVEEGRNLPASEMVQIHNHASLPTHSSNFA